MNPLAPSMAQRGMMHPALSVATANATSCINCDEGWTCEKHAGVPWPHPDPDPARIHDQCAGPGMPCANGCLGLNAMGDEVAP